MSLWAGLRRRHRRNVRTLRRRPLAEVSGALGDLGTLLPLMTALAVQGSVSLSATLVVSGLANVVSGAVFGLPLPVQPMKAVAAAAMATHAPLRHTVAAGALVSGAVLVLAATGLLRRLAAAVPAAVVRGIQLGAGLSLVVAGGGGGGLLGRLRWLGPSWLDNRLWALAAFGGLLLTQRGAVVVVRGGGGGGGGSGSGSGGSGSGSGARVFFFPYALVLFLVGLVLAVLLAVDHHHGLPRFALWHPHLVLPAWTAADPWAMAVAQLPLTTLNSVVAVSALADDLFGGVANGGGEGGGEDGDDDDDGYENAGITHNTGHDDDDAPLFLTSVTAFGLSVGCMNLLGCWLGAMPVCHGAGGLAAQHRFGARSGASVVLLGLAKMALGLLFGETLVDLLRAFPASVLGVLVLAAGLELALAGVLGLLADGDRPGGRRGHGRGGGGHDRGNGGDAGAILRGPRPAQRAATAADRERYTVLLVTAGGILAFKNDAVGFLAGMLCHVAYRLVDRLGEGDGQPPAGGEGEPGAGQDPEEHSPLLR